MRQAYFLALTCLTLWAAPARADAPYYPPRLGGVDGPAHHTRHLEAANSSLLGPQAFTYSPTAFAYQALSYQAGSFPAFQAAWVYAFQSGTLSTSSVLSIGNSVVAGLILDALGNGPPMLRSESKRSQDK